MTTGLLVVRILIFLILFGGPLIALVLYRRMKVKQDRLSWEASQQYTIFEVMVPKLNAKSPLAAEQMLASLHGIFREDESYQYQLSFEMAAHNQFIHFYVHVPTHLKDFVEGQMYAQYPTVEIKEVDDYTRHDFTGQVVAGMDLELTKPYVYPIKTFQSFDVDPMSAITAVLGKIGTDEQSWIQLIVRPVSDDWQLKGISFASAKRSGASGEPTPRWRSFLGSIIEFALDLFRTAVGTGESTDSKGKGDVKKLSSPEEAAVKGIETKITKLGFEARIRVIALAPDELSAKSRIEGLSGAYKQFNTTNLNGFRATPIRVGDDLLDDYRQRRFSSDGYILNIEELASLYHFPAESVETPNIVWAGSKKGEPPANLPFEGAVPPEELTVFGETDFRSMRRRFGIKKGDRRLHMYAMGKTGTGKSTVLENMIIDDIQKGRGVAVVDPHGDLVDHVLNFIPDHRMNDVIYFNPADRDFPVAFNLLETMDPNLKNIAASGLMSIFTKLWENVWSARMEYILRNAILALLEYPGATFLEIMRLLSDAKFRKKVLTHVKDPVIRDFFLNEFERYEPKFRTEAIAPIQNKVGQFLSASTIRNIVGQTNSSFDIRKAMDERKILLIDLSVGKIGEDNAALMGAMMITKIQLAAMTRVDTPEAERVDFYLYVDEFQNFATDSFAVILSEARKYRLNLILTNQYIAQMPETVAKAIFGNIGTLIAFRTGSNDASVLAKELEPVFDANDLVNIDNYHVYLKMSIDGVTRPAFSARTLPPYKGANNNRDTIIAASRATYARPLDMVEAQLAENARQHSGESGEVNDARYDEPGVPGEPAKPVGPKYRRLGKSKDGIVWYGTDDVPAPETSSSTPVATATEELALPVGETSDLLELPAEPELLEIEAPKSDDEAENTAAQVAEPATEPTPKNQEKPRRRLLNLPEFDQRLTETVKDDTSIESQHAAPEPSGDEPLLSVDEVPEDSHSSDVLPALPPLPKSKPDDILPIDEL